MTKDDTIVLGGEEEDHLAARKDRWAARDTDLANTPLTLEDIERLLRSLPEVTQDALDAVKRSRGKAMP